MTSDGWLEDEEQQAWRELLRGTRLLFESLDHQLQRDAGMPHAYYLILAVLAEAPERTLSMGRLADRAHCSPSRLSHAVARLEDQGWVRRTNDPTDRRTTLAQLTDAGADTVVRAAPGHAAALRRQLFDHLTPEQVRVLREAFAAVPGAEAASRS